MLQHCRFGPAEAWQELWTYLLQHYLNVNQMQQHNTAGKAPALLKWRPARVQYAFFEWNLHARMPWFPVFAPLEGCHDCLPVHTVNCVQPRKVHTVNCVQPRKVHTVNCVQPRKVHPAFSKTALLPAGAVAAAAKRGVQWLRTRSQLLPGFGVRFRT
jgi:hypothetical protein